MCINLCTVCGVIHATMAELGSCDRDLVAQKAESI